MQLRLLKNGVAKYDEGRRNLTSKVACTA